MMARRTLLWLALGASLLSGCSGNQRGAEACANSKLLRIKVGETLFDLPNTVQMPHALTIDHARKPEKLGIVSLGHAARRSDPANRMDCNDKTQPVADFGNAVGLTYRGDGTEPEEYRLGDKMYALVDIVRYDPKSTSSWRSEYLANVEEIANVRFVRRTELPPVANIRTREAIYEFSYSGRIIKMRCQIWDDAIYEDRRDDPRPSYPNQCVPKMPFRAGDIVIGVDQRSYTGGPGAKARLIPPEEWPKQWAYTINKILSFRVHGTKDFER